MIRLGIIIAVACMPAWLRAQQPAPVAAPATDSVTPLPSASVDLVVLTNGNRMMGTMQALARGRLSFEIAGAGTVPIDWRNVETLVSAQRLDVELSSGERLLGSLAAAPAGSLTVVTSAASRTVGMRDVVRIARIRATFVERTAGSIDVGFSLLGANDQFDLTLSGAAQNRTQNFLTEARLSLLTRRIDGETSQRRNHFDLKSRRFVRNRWFALGTMEVEENRQLDLDLRVLLGVAPGRTLVQSNRMVLSVYGGLDYAFADYHDVPDSESAAEALAALEWDVFDVGADTQLLFEGTSYFRLGDPGTRVELAGTLRHDIGNDFYASLVAYLSSNSEPPPGREHSDYGVAFTLGRAF